MKFVQANRIAPDGTPRFAASNLGLICLLMPHKKDARLIWVKAALIILSAFSSLGNMLLSYPLNFGVIEDVCFFLSSSEDMQSFMQ